VIVSFSEEENKKDAALQRAQSLVGTSAGRAENDFYPTPPEATRALLDHEKFRGRIWEPACGDGAICKILEANGYNDVLATDLIDRGYGEGGHDFFQSELRADNIITNPPFKLAERFVRLSLAKTTGKVAMLLKLAFLEGQARKTMFQSTPFARVYVFSKRITMWRNGEEKPSSSMMCFAWFIWEHGYTAEPIVRWI
jgi:hypothetical protein